MTTEEKYNKALELARTYYNGGNEFLDTIFPELKESEDERIRKGLVQHLKELRNWKVGTMAPIKVAAHYDAWIAYLEKQNDANKEYWRGYREGKQEILDKYAEIEKQKEEKSTLVEKLRSISTPADENWFEIQKRWEKEDEQKPAEWSEDERIRKALIEVFKKKLEKGFEWVEYGIPNRSVLGWLEKQKKQKDYHKLYEDIAQSKWFKKACVGKSLGEEFEKKEKTPAECIDFDNEFENQISHLLASVLNGEHEYNEGFVKYAAQSLLGYAKNEQKPAEYEKPLLREFEQAVYDCAWGKVTCKPEGETQEEYAKRWEEHLLMMIRDWADDYIDSQIVSAERKAYDKGKADAEKPAEWSEEDEKAAYFINQFLEYHEASDPTAKSCKEWFNNRLKSLHPDSYKNCNSRWKPSEEQLSQLQFALNLLEEKCGSVPNVLWNLYDDLKKL